MFGYRLLKSAAVGLATIGLMVPQARVLADMPEVKAPVAKTKPAVRVPDLVLTTGGTVTGRVCNPTGKMIEGAKVQLKQDDKMLATTVTDKNGMYSFKNVKGGVYNMSSGNTEGVFRVWSDKTAPPTAKEHALLVVGENGARGQFGNVDPTLVVLTAGVIASIVVGAVAINKIDHVSDQVSAIPVSP